MKSAKANYSCPDEAIVLVVQLGTQLKEENGEYYLAVSALKNRKVYDTYEIDMKNYLNEKQSAYSLGSGFFVKPNIIATAAHVLLEPNRYQNTAIENVRFINCYHEPLDEESIENGELRIDKANIFKPIDPQLKDGYYGYSGTNEDWAFVPVVNETGRPAEVRFLEIDTGGVKEKDKVSWYGHPLGLPLSTVSNNKGKDKDKNEIREVIKEVNTEGIFEIRNTAYPGLSGAPVLKEGKVVGIVVRGMAQLELDKENEKVSISQPDMGKHEGAECQSFTIDLNARIDNLS